MGYFSANRRRPQRRLKHLPNYRLSATRRFLPTRWLRQHETAFDLDMPQTKLGEVIRLWDPHKTSGSTCGNSCTNCLRPLFESPTVHQSTLGTRRCIHEDKITGLPPEPWHELVPLCDHPSLHWFPNQSLVVKKRFCSAHSVTSRVCFSTTGPSCVRHVDVLAHRIPLYLIGFSGTAFHAANLLGRHDAPPLIPNDHNSKVQRS